MSNASSHSDAIRDQAARQQAPASAEPAESNDLARGVRIDSKVFGTLYVPGPPATKAQDGDAVADWLARRELASASPKP